MSFPFGEVLAGPGVESGRCMQHCQDFGLGSKSFAPGEVFAAHRHDRHEEIFVGVTGAVTLQVEGVEHTIGPGDKIAIRRGVVHRLQNRGPGGAEVTFLKIPFIADDTIWC